MRHRQSPPVCCALMILLLLGLAGCSSIPLGTLTRFAGADPIEVLAATDGNEIGAVIRVENWLAMDEANVKLSIEISHGDALITHEFQFVLNGKRDLTRPRLWRADEAITAWQWVLDEKSKDSFATFQDHLLVLLKEDPQAFADDSVNLSVSFTDMTMRSPEDSQAHVDIDLQLNAEQGYFSLIDDYVMDLSTQS